MMSFLRILMFISLSVLLNVCAIADSRQKVSVALTSIQPPFVIDEASRHGLAYDVVDALNRHQGLYEFQAKLIPAKRLLSDHDALGEHVVAFNDELWGWKQRGGAGSLTLTDGKDVFFSLNETSTKDTIAAVRGFHYAFSGFDPEKLSRMPNVTVVNDEPTVLEMVIQKRTDRGITSLAFLKWISVSSPELYSRLRIDPEEDHTYNRQFIVFPYSPVSVGIINRYLTEMKEEGILPRIYKTYGLESPPLKERIH
ncbi:MAG: hypothetical protein ABW085_05780 [Sedimenticola sp.]